MRWRSCKCRASPLNAWALDVLKYDERIREVAAAVAEARDVRYLGRGSAFPLALEAALKLKEISCIHAEGYAAGEVKHGPSALIDEAVPIIVHPTRYQRTNQNSLTRFHRITPIGSLSHPCPHLAERRNYGFMGRSGLRLRKTRALQKG